MSTAALLRSAILVIAPATLLAGGLYHPWIGSPGDAGFLTGLAAAVSAGPTRWAVAHLTVAVGSGLLMLAFLVVHESLREAGAGRFSLWGVPFVVLGSTLYALLPAMEFVPLAAAEAGGDAAAAQAALFRWFRPTLMIAAITFAVGVLGFAIGLARSGLLGTVSTWIVVGSLAVMALARFVPVGAAQLYVGPLAGTVALWTLAYALSASRRPVPEERPVPAA